MSLSYLPRLAFAFLLVFLYPMPLLVLCLKDTRRVTCFENNNRTVRVAHHLTVTEDQKASWIRNLLKFNEGIDENCGVIDENLKQRSWLGEIRNSTRNRCLVVFVSKTRAVVSSYCIETLRKNQDENDLYHLNEVILWNGDRVKIRSWFKDNDFTEAEIITIWYELSLERISPICLPGHNNHYGLPDGQKVLALDFDYVIDLSNDTTTEDIFQFYLDLTWKEKNEKKYLQETGGVLIVKRNKKWYIDAVDVGISSINHFFGKISLASFEIMYKHPKKESLAMIMKSPCPQTFQYGKYDDLYAAFIDLEVPLTKRLKSSITAQFYVPKDFVLPSNSTFNITVYDNDNEDDNEDFSNAFVILFPPKMIFPLKQITLNGNVKCEHNKNQHIFRNSETITGYYEFSDDDAVKHLDDSSKVNQKSCGKLNSTFIESDQHFNNHPWIAQFVCPDEDKCLAFITSCPIVLISTQLAIVDGNCTKLIEFKHIKIFNGQSLKIRYFIKNPVSSQNIGLLVLETKLKSPEFVPACMWKYEEDELEKINGIWTRFNGNQRYSKNISTTTCPPKLFEKYNNLFCIHSESKHFAHEEGLFFHEVDNQWYIRGIYISYKDSYYYFIDVAPSYDWITNYEKTRALTSPFKKSKRAIQDRLTDHCGATRFGLFWKSSVAEYMLEEQHDVDLEHSNRIKYVRDAYKLDAWESFLINISPLPLMHREPASINSSLFNITDLEIK